MQLWWNSSSCILPGLLLVRHAEGRRTQALIYTVFRIFPKVVVHVTNAATLCYFWKLRVLVMFISLAGTLTTARLAIEKDVRILFVLLWVAALLFITIPV